MKIEQDWDFVEGSFDTETTDMVCVSKHKYNDVILCVRTPGSSQGALLPIARIKLHSQDTNASAAKVFEDAEKLGYEIARRWNNCGDKK